MKIIINSIFLLIFSSLFMLSCDDDDKTTTACTDIYMHISVKVQYSDESPVALDSYKVMWGDKDITLVKDFESEEYKMAQKAGSYAIVNDDIQPELEGKSIPVMVYGYIDDKEVFAEEFKVTADRCHVDYQDDKPLKITIENP